MEDLRQKSSAG